MPLAEPAVKVAISSGPRNETQSQSEPLCKLFELPQPPDTGRISLRTTKIQRLFRYSPTNYCLYILFILCCFDTVVDAAPLPLWNKEITKEQPIINRSMLWHHQERAIFLKEYQFMTVVNKILSPRTSDGKYLCVVRSIKLKSTHPRGILNAKEKLSFGLSVLCHLNWLTCHKKPITAAVKEVLRLYRLLNK